MQWLEEEEVEEEEEESRAVLHERLAFVSCCHVQGVPCLLHKGSWERLQKTHPHPCDPPIKEEAVEDR